VRTTAGLALEQLPGAIGLEPRFAFVNDQLLFDLFGGEPEKAIREIRAYVEVP
jgi:hypothetical protein